MPVWKHVFMKAPLCESIGVPYVGRLLLESLSYVVFAAKLLGFCSILQLAPVHCMAWCNISSLHGALPSGKICSSAKPTSANCMVVARYGIISANCAVMFTALWSKKSAHCRMFAVSGNQKTITCTVCAAYWCKCYCIDSLCNICNYHWLTTWHAQHFEICVCPLDAIFMTFWSSNLQVGGIRDILKLSSADCTTWHGVCSMLRLFAANICKLHGLCHISKPTFANCLGPATLWK